MQIKLQNEQIENLIKQSSLTNKSEDELIELINEHTQASIYENSEQGFDEAFSSAYYAVRYINQYSYYHEFIMRTEPNEYFNSCDLDHGDLFEMLEDEGYKPTTKSWIDYLEYVKQDKSISYRDLPIDNPFDKQEVQNALTDIIIALVNKNQFETIKLIKSDIDLVGTLQPTETQQ